MTQVPIIYFAPDNGQCMTLEERIEELFKADTQIKVEELNKVYDSGQITKLMADVTAFLSKNQVRSNHPLNNRNYSSNKGLLDAIKQEFFYTVPPVKVSFDTKEHLEEFVSVEDKDVDLSSKSNKGFRCKRLFLCKKANKGLALNLNENEIRDLKENSFPLMVSFNSYDEVLDFVWAYNHPRNLKGNNNGQDKWDGERAIQRSKYIALACLAGLTLLLLGVTKYVPSLFAKLQPVEVSEKNSGSQHSDSIPNWVYGTWSCTTPYGTETIKIEKGGTIVDLTSGSLKTGSYTYENGTIRARYSGELGIATTIGVDLSGRRLEYGGGYYFHKK